MKNILDPLGLKVVRKLLETRWSPRNDVVSALLDFKSHIKSTLFQNAEKLEQKIETRTTTKGLLTKINNLGSTFLLCFWKTILERFNKKQFKLQRSDITLSSTWEVYSPLEEYRGTFETFEKEVIIMWK